MALIYFSKNKFFTGLIFTITLSATFLPGCKKAVLKCEKWEVEDAAHTIGGCIDLSCGGKRTLYLNFCGSALTDAKEGNTIVLSEDNCCKRTRTFVRRIE
jgi:uncharacterized 2Fe-2S/4Fe-4S cluster protein (DUF4445 family)